MKHLVRVSLAMTALFMSLLPESGAAQSYSSLTGITQVSLEISVDPEIGSWAITPESFRPSLEVKLRTSGLKVIDEPRAGVPRLVVTVRLRTKEPAYAYAYYTGLDLNEFVEVPRAGSQKVLASIWGAGNLSLVYDPEKLRENVRLHLDSLLDDFINEVLKANGR
jgi:hypothetical protein